MTTARNFQVAIVDGALTVLGLVLLGFGVWALWKENLGLAGTALGAGLILLFAATIHRFETLKGLGMEARTRELKSTLDQAEAATDQLKDMVDFVSRNVLLLNSSIGRFSDAPSIMDAYQVSRRVKKLLTTIKSSDSEIREALLPWAKTVAFDALASVHHEMELELRKIEAICQERIINHDPEASKYRERLTKIQSYLARRIAGLEKWSLTQIADEIGRIADGAPALPDEVRSILRSKFLVTQEQLHYLAENLDFKDLGFWLNFKRAHELESTD